MLNRNIKIGEKNRLLTPRLKRVITAMINSPVNHDRAHSRIVKRIIPSILILKLHHQAIQRRSLTRTTVPSVRGPKVEGARVEAGLTFAIRASN
jgi:predicted metal-dependent hydrolase